MSYRTTLPLFVSVMLLGTVLASEGSAQLRSGVQPRQRVMRWLGQGYGAGYHWRQPGPNSDYYHPWSPHNSLLVSQTEAAQQNLGIPHSEYAPIGQRKNQFSYPPENSADEQAPSVESEPTESDSSAGYFFKPNPYRRAGSRKR